MTSEKPFKEKFLDFLLLFFIYLVASSFPYAYLIEDKNLSISIRLLVGGIFALSAFIFLQYRYPNQKRPFSFKTLLLFLPFFIICFSNITSSMFVSSPGGVASPSYLALTILSTVVYAISEELLFRRFLLPLLLQKMPELGAIFLSSLLFSLVHLLNLFEGAAFPMVLLQVLYTFGIGLVLSLMYLYGNSLMLPICFHSLFNIFQNDLYGALYPGEGYSSIRIWVTVGVTIFGLLYGLFICFHFRKKESSSSLDKQDR